MTKEISKSVVKATGVVLVINIIVKVLGYLRESFIANGFGLNWMTDSYNVAYTLPYFLQAILGYALVSAVVPVLTKYWVKDAEEEGFYVANSLINVTALILGAISIIGIIAAPALVFITAPNLPSEANQLSINLTRIMFPSLLFMGLGMVMTGILNSRYCFFSWFAPGISNIVIILGVVIFSYMGILSLGWVTLISYLGFMLINVPFLIQTGFKYRFIIDFKHPAVKQVLWGILPISLGVAVNQIYFALNRVFASGMVEGSISALNYASKVMNMPIGIFVAAVIAGSYPALAEKAMADDRLSLSQTLHKSLGLITFLAIPSTVGLIILREPVVQLLFQSGAFNASDTQVTAYALLFFAFGIIPVSFNMMLVRVFYVFDNVKIPVIMGMISILFDIVFSLIFSRVLAHGGLALANTLAAFVNVALFYIYLYRKAPYLELSKIIKQFIKMLISAVIMGIVVFVAMRFISHIGGMGKMWQAIRVAVYIGLGGVIYFIATYLIGVDEIKDIYELFKKKLINRLTR